MKFQKKLLILSLLALPVGSAFADGMVSTAESDAKSAGSAVENGAKDLYNDIGNMFDGGTAPFTGAYVGAKTGINDSKMQVGNATAAGSSVLPAGTTGNSPQNYGAAVGAEAGYAWKLGSTVLGVDGAYGYNGSGRFGTLGGSNTTPGYGSYASHDWALGLKFGIPVSDVLMPYAKLGYGRLIGTGAANGLSGNGLNGGLGLEYLFAPHWSVAGEWNNMSTTVNSNTLNNNTYTIGVNYYFTAAHKHHVVAAAAPVVAPVAAPEPVAAPAPAPVDRWRTITEEKPVSLDGANFKTNSAVLNKTADEKLMQVVDFSKRYPEADIQVDGFTDNVGSKAYNKKLSLRRADAVKSYLSKKGVDASRIHTTGHGMEDPVASNKTAAGRAQNRHVEVHYTVREEKKVRVQN